MVVLTPALVASDVSQDGGIYKLPSKSLAGKYLSRIQEPQAGKRGFDPAMNFATIAPRPNPVLNVAPRKSLACRFPKSHNK
jgi:hypothetical protein